MFERLDGNETRDTIITTLIAYIPNIGGVWVYYGIRSELPPIHKLNNSTYLSCLSSVDRSGVIFINYITIMNIIMGIATMLEVGTNADF